MEEALTDFKDELGAVHLLSGPGSYTGLRIGYSLALGLAKGLGIKLIESDAGEVLSEAFYEKETDFKHLLVAIDARREEIYGSFYNISKKVCISEMKPIILDADLEVFPEDIQRNHLAVIGNGAFKLTKYLDHPKYVYTKELNALDLCKTGLKKYDRQMFTDLNSAKPLYLKPPRIIQSKKKIL
jgi:tRNA threonylcarbamoyladenosine biosynthesis protein TsaB